MKTSELTGAALDWAVAKCEGEEVSLIRGQLETRWTDNGWKPSADWAQGGPIIEREGIGLNTHDARWLASLVHEDKKYGGIERTEKYGLTPLIAAMRCYVASKLGDEVEIPTELQGA